MNRKLQLLGTAFATLLLTVFVLDRYGYIRHSSKQDAIYLAEFNVLAQTPGLTQVLSLQPSDFVAHCEQGHIVVSADKKDKEQPLVGILVDRHKRSVRCSTDLKFYPIREPLVPLQPSQGTGRER